VLNGSSGFVYYVSITGITGNAQHDGRASRRSDSRASGTPLICRSPSASVYGRRRRRPTAVRVPDAAVVGSALCSTIEANLGKPEMVRKVLDQVRERANGVRGARVNA